MNNTRQPINSMRRKAISEMQCTLQKGWFLVRKNFLLKKPLSVEVIPVLELSCTILRGKNFIDGNDFYKLERPKYTWSVAWAANKVIASIQPPPCQSHNGVFANLLKFCHLLDSNAFLATSACLVITQTASLFFLKKSFL